MANIGVTELARRASAIARLKVGKWFLVVKLNNDIQLHLQCNMRLRLGSDIDKANVIL